MSVKKWGGWEVIKKEDLVKQAEARAPVMPPEVDSASSPQAKLEKPFDPKKLEKIEPKKITEAEQLAYARELSRIDQFAKPEVCALCGNSIAKEFFLLRTPEAVKICRSCKQSDNRCPNCREVHRIEVKGLTAFCKSCKIQKECTSCARPVSPTDIHRVEGKKGVYCAECFSGKERCLFCGLPTKIHLENNPRNICTFCQADALTDEGAALDSLDKVIHFFFGLDDKLTIEVLPVMFDPAATFRVHQDVFYFPKGAPEAWLQSRLVDYYARQIIASWKKVKPASPLAASLSIFFQMIFADHLKDFLRFEEWKKTGLRSNKEFQPLHQAWYKLGAGPAVKYLKKLLS